MCAEIIEIIGPPGIGKTTIYNALCKKWRASFNWIYQGALLMPAPSLEDFNSWIVFRIKKLLNGGGAKSIPIEFGLRFAQNHPRLANFCWEQLSDASIYQNDNSALRFRSVYLLYLDFCRYQAIDEKKSFIPCLLNEGFLQKSFLVQSDLVLMPDLINKYLPLVPLPKAIIYVNTEDKGIIVQRLVNRSKTIASHLGKNKNDLLGDILKWQFQLELIISWMLDHNVVVYNIDGEKSIKENVLSITKILEGQKHSDSSFAQKNTINFTAYRQ
ncbi:hypothetical protein [Flavitalea sp.]|nr:hypothetical protein [Flavitalea sp.]